MPDVLPSGEEIRRVSLETANGRPFELWERLSTNDGALISSLVGSDEYRLAGRHFEGWAIDVGSHIGTLAVALAVDNPDLRVLAIEAVPDNIEAIRHNVRVNGLEDRVIVVPEAAGAPGQTELVCWWAFTSADGMDLGYVHANRFIGNVFRDPWVERWDGRKEMIPAVSLGVLLDRYGIDEVAFCKTDCEGSEWAFFSDPARARVREVIGEWHDRHADAEDSLAALFAGTHDIEILVDQGGIGLFRATRR